MRYKRGDLLPVENIMCRALSVSRTGGVGVAAHPPVVQRTNARVASAPLACTGEARAMRGGQGVPEPQIPYARLFASDRTTPSSLDDP